MKVEHDIRIIALDENFDAELKAMQEQGWRPAPGYPPFAVYPVVRDESTMPKPADVIPISGFGGIMGGHIDESKVHIIKAGEKPPAA